MNQWIRYSLLAHVAVLGTLGVDGTAMADASLASAATTLAMAPSKDRVTSVCPPDVCGRNSAEVEAYPLEELDLDGKPSRGGFRIVGVGLADGHNFPISDPQIKLDVDDGELVALRGSKATRHRVGGLVVQQGLTVYGIKFTEVRYVRSWARRSGCDHTDPSTRYHTECYETAYALEYTKMGSGVGYWGKDLNLDEDFDGKPNLCTQVPSWGHEWATFVPPKEVKGKFGYRNTERWSSPTASALLVKGEVYDYQSATIVKPKPPGRWFNIACAGSAIGKMKLMGYDPETTKPDWKTAPWQRQATLKMITANYCPAVSSERFTHSGQNLAFQNRARWFDPWSRVEAKDSQVEAFWNHNGATCLTLPRAEGWQAKAAWIRKKCGLPTCEKFFAKANKKKTKQAAKDAVIKKLQMSKDKPSVSVAEYAFTAGGGVLDADEEWVTFNRLP